MEKRRGSELIAIIGTNGTGKTVVARMLIEKFNAKRDRLNGTKKYPANYNKLIIYDPQHRFQDLLRKGDFEIKLNNKNWEKDVLRYKSSLIVLDDYKELFRSNNLSDGFTDVMSARAESGLDIIFITWFPRYILPRLSQFINKYFLFKVNCKDKEYIDRINGEEDVVLNIKSSLNKEFKKYTPNEYSNLYPNFPFVYFNADTNEGKKVNFK